MNNKNYDYSIEINLNSCECESCIENKNGYNWTIWQYDKDGNQANAGFGGSSSPEKAFEDAMEIFRLDEEE